MSSRGRPGNPSARQLLILIKRMLPLVLVGLCAALPAVGQQSANEQAVWKLETAYWNYVKAVDLDGYRSLWHRDFVGWPSSSAQPARKDHITDWITAQTSKGLKFKTEEFKPASIQVTTTWPFGVSTTPVYQ